MSCDKLSMGIPFDCDKLIAPGQEDQIVLANFTDVDRDPANLVTGENTKIETLALLNSAKAYVFGGSNNSNNANEGNDRGGINKQKYNHTVQFRIQQDNEEVPEILRELVGSKLIAFCFKNSQLVKVYGWDSGLVATYTKDDTENDAVYDLSLANEEGFFQLTPPKTYVKDGLTSYADLKADVIALTV